MSTTDRHHKEGQEKKNKALCSELAAEVVIDGRLNKNRERKAHFLAGFGKQKPLSLKKKEEALTGSDVYR